MLGMVVLASTAEPVATLGRTGTVAPAVLDCRVLLVSMAHQPSSPGAMGAMVQPEVMGQKVEQVALADRSLVMAAMEGLVATVAMVEPEAPAPLAPTVSLQDLRVATVAAVAMVEQPATGAWGAPVVPHQEVARRGQVEHSALAARWAMGAMVLSAELVPWVALADPVALAVMGSMAAMAATAGPAAPGWMESSRLE